MCAAMPYRNTVKITVNKIARESREKISTLLKKAIKCGGVAASTDTWTDDYKKLTYIAVVVHLNIYEDEKLITTASY